MVFRVTFTEWTRCPECGFPFFDWLSPNNDDESCYIQCCYCDWTGRFNDAAIDKDTRSFGIGVPDRLSVQLWKAVWADDKEALAALKVENDTRMAELQAKAIEKTKEKPKWQN